MKFQSTRLHEARRLAAVDHQQDQRFQSTRLHEARHTPGVVDASLAKFQSTRLHEARPADVDRPARHAAVSIHAPA